MTDDDFDFGFSTVSAEEYNEQIISKDTKVDNIYNAIMPLLNNLLKDADTNPYIHWPDRKAKIEQFIQKLKKIKDA